MSSKTSKEVGSSGRDGGHTNKRRERLAKELRSNLLKRKALSKVRAAHETAGASTKDDPSA